jgi:hypothetical protein
MQELQSDCSRFGRKGLPSTLCQHEFRHHACLVAWLWAGPLNGACEEFEKLTKKGESAPKTTPKIADLLEKGAASWLLQLEGSIKDANQVTTDAAPSVVFELGVAGVKRKESTIEVKISRRDVSGKPKAVVFSLHPLSMSVPNDVETHLRELILKLAYTTDPNSTSKTARRLVGSGAPDVLEDILKSGRCFLEGVTQPLKLGKPKKASFEWNQANDGSYRFTILAAGLMVLPLDEPFYLDIVNRECGRLVVDAPKQVVSSLLKAPPMPSEALIAVRDRLEPLGDSVRQVLPPRPKISVVSKNPKVQIHIYRQELTLIPKGRKNIAKNQLRDKVAFADVSLQYGGVSVDFPSPRPTSKVAAREVNGLGETIYTRDEQFETVLTKKLHTYGFLPAKDISFTMPRRKDGSLVHYRAFDTEVSKFTELYLDLVANVVPKLKNEGWQVTLDEELKVIPADKVSWDVTTKALGVEWFDLHFGVTVGGERYDMVPLIVSALSSEAFQSANKVADVPDKTKLFHTLPNGKVIEVPAWRVKPVVLALYELFGTPDSWLGPLKLPAARATDLDEMERLAKGAKLNWTEPKQIHELRERLREFKSIKAIEPPESLVGKLRPYQADGLAWLGFLRDFGFGGVLADDMGLGKTVQTLAHLLVEKESGRLDRPALIVAPTSTLPNWRHECSQFAPSLRLAVLHGTERKSLYANNSEHDVLLTSYALLARDTQQLSKVPFHLVVLDEAQNIKNPGTAVAKAACSLNSRHRICLSGTPVENNLEELWSLFNFLMPGFLGELIHFRKTFRTPIEQNQDEYARKMLVSRISPFVLRRTKENVAKELPPKTEILERVPLEGGQRDLYESLRIAMDKRVQELLAGKGLNKSRIEILDALLKLRQACCDPRLVKLPAAKTVQESAKLTRLLEMLEELIDEGRKVLIFSQFTSMLDLIEISLKAAKIEWVRISGETKDRETPVKEFQAGKVPVFLISLKAGGTGLNLTAADTVIHYDPWWNPAVENQATDRAHRIGQDKSVFVYKLLAKDSIEEKILILQERKAGLAGAILSKDADPVATLSADDLKWIFE